MKADFSCMKKFLRIKLIIFLILWLCHFSAKPGLAFTPNTSGSLTLTPVTADMQTGEIYPIRIGFNSANESISGIALRLVIPNSLDLEVISVAPDPAVASWSFPVTNVSTLNGNTVVDIMGLILSPGGFTTNGDVALATVTLRPLQPFSRKTLTFAKTQTQMLKKADALDILGALGEATLTSLGIQAVPVKPQPPPLVKPSPILEDNSELNQPLEANPLPLTYEPPDGTMPAGENALPDPTLLPPLAQNIIRASPDLNDIASTPPEVVAAIPAAPSRNNLFGSIGPFELVMVGLIIVLVLALIFVKKKRGKAVIYKDKPYNPFNLPGPTPPTP